MVVWKYILVSGYCIAEAIKNIPRRGKVVLFGEEMESIFQENKCKYLQYKL